MYSYSGIRSIERTLKLLYSIVFKLHQETWQIRIEYNTHTHTKKEMQRDMSPMQSTSRYKYAYHKKQEKTQPFNKKYRVYIQCMERMHE